MLCQCERLPYLLMVECGAIDSSINSGNWTACTNFTAIMNCIFASMWSHDVIMLACRDLSKNERIQRPWSLGVVTQACTGRPHFRFKSLLSLSPS